jgi:CubicO group peptidase (beta-lactamase class C family)
MIPHRRRPARCLAALAWALTAAPAFAQPMALPAATAQPAPTPPPRDAANASFWERYDDQPTDPVMPPLDWYKPTGVLAGRAAPFLPAATTLPAPMLEAAAQFAGATGSESLIVLRNGRVELERYFAGPADHRFSSHSMAKSLNALAIGAAIRDGRIRSVDQPASTWIREWRGDARRAITIRQLLQMAGGFSAPFSREPSSHYIQQNWGSDVERIVRDAPLVAGPGTAFAYDADNNHALSLVIERATGRPYARYLGKRIWAPIGAADAQLLIDRPGGRAMAFCCLVATPRDWARVGQLLLDDGVWNGRRLLPAGWVRAMTTPSPANANFGYQVFLGDAYASPQNNRRAADQAGTQPALPPGSWYLSGAGGQTVVIVPSERLVVVRSGAIHLGFRESVIPALLSAAARGTRPDYEWLTAYRASLRRPAGDYTLENSPALYWPVERVSGGNGAPLPRRASACLTRETLAAPLAELAANGTYDLQIWRDGAVEFEQRWPGTARDSRAESASMHKSVLALVIGLAVSDGTLSLDAPVSRWLTEWRGDARGAMTIRQMLSMASGLKPLPFSQDPKSLSARLNLGPDLLAADLELPLADPPGTRFNYLNPVPQLLGEVLQRATGERYAAYLSRRLWQPLGAADAYVTLDRPGGLARVSGTLLATAEDWTRLGVLIAGRGGGIVPADWIAQMTAPSPANPNYGFLIWRGSPHNPARGYNSASPLKIPAAEPFALADTVYFDGAGAERVYVSPSAKLVITRIGRPDLKWDDSRLPNQIAAVLARCGR